MCDLPVEECWVLLLNQSSKIIDRICISRGGLASTQVDVRCILREALLKRAVSMVLCIITLLETHRPAAMTTV